jgi:hypothetical protein
MSDNSIHQVAETSDRFNTLLGGGGLANLPPLLALSFLGFAFSEQGEKSLAVSNSRLEGIRENLEKINDASAALTAFQSANSDALSGDDGKATIDGPLKDQLESILLKFGGYSQDEFNKLFDGDQIKGKGVQGALDNLQTASTSQSNELQRLITQAQSDANRIEQGNSFGESARQTSQTNTDVLLGRA